MWLLLSCVPAWGRARLVLRLRSVSPSEQVMAALHEADLMLRQAFERSLEHSPNDDALEQAKLGTASDGMGLRCATDLSCPAFFGSVADTAGMVAKLLCKDAVVVLKLCLCDCGGQRCNRRPGTVDS